MKEKKTDLLQGTLDLLVLKALALGPLHGLGVSNRIALHARPYKNHDSLVLRDE
jgi:hypothetical protein